MSATGPLPPEAAALAAALGDDPFYAALVEHLPVGSPERQVVLAHYFAYAIEEAATHGRLALADPPGTGAALWLLPEAEHARVARETAKARALGAILGATGVGRYAAMVAFMEAQAAPLLSADCWYLSILGVAPGLQGRGHGAALLRPVLAEADAGGAPCYLETFGERSLAFYRRAGFAPLASFVEPLTGARYWLLRREPRALDERPR
jgi:ribosomal protein S18 acetylase RimI-like enzyme